MPESGHSIPQLPDESWVDSKLGMIAASALAVAEVLPVNIAAFGAIQSAYDNPLLTAITFAGTTLATKIAGSIAAVDLMDSKVGSKPVDWISNKLAGHNFTRGVNTPSGNPLVLLV